MDSDSLRPGLARVRTATLRGLMAVGVRVEADVRADLPGFSLVGLPSAALRESRERVGSAMRNAGFAWPDGRITVSLAPADLRKDGAAMDLAMAASLLLATGQIPRPDPHLLRRTLLLGELALDGALRSTRGVPTVALDARELGVDRLVVPEGQAAELAPMVGEVELLGVRHLAELPSALLRAPRRPRRIREDDAEVEEPILEPVHGQQRALRAMSLAAAGGHHLLLQGPPGCGKTLIARQLAALLPPLGSVARRERLRILGAVQAEVDRSAIARPPLRAPHASVSPVGLLGGGRPLRPGEITLAHRGVLFLDEIAEFGRERLDRLREPLGEGWVDLSRAGERYRFPARFQLVAAGNPCPCGWYGSHVDRCRCEPHAVARYRRRLSGPLRDRIDLWVEMDREPVERIFTPSNEAQILDVTRVRALRRENDAREEFSPSLRDSLRRCRLDGSARELLRELADRRAASLRAVASVLRVARSIADLAGEPRVREEDLAEAFTYRPPAC